jgi:hypothetical protein
MAAFICSANQGTLIEEKPGLVAELIKEMRSPRSTVEDVFKRTRMDVLRGSNSKQAPWYSSTLEEEFIFSAPAGRPTATQARTDRCPTTKSQPRRPGDCAEAGHAGQPRRRAGRIDQAVGCPNSRQSERCRGHLHARTDLCEEQELFYAKNRNFSRAIKDFDEVVRLDPKCRGAQQSLLGARHHRPSFRRTEAAGFRPRYADAYDSRGLVHLKRGSFKDAVIDYDTALGINPNQALGLWPRSCQTAQRR